MDALTAPPRALELEDSFSPDEDSDADDRSLSPADDASAVDDASIADDASMAGDSETEDREHRDDLLLKLREKGYPYRYIKRYGRFKEAESTLRGRYRSLTKDKGERVRRPQWETKDVALLRQAARQYTDGTLGKPRMRSGRSKIPWKKISEWMKKHGSSYLFAPATCAKKWDALNK